MRRKESMSGWIVNSTSGEGMDKISVNAYLYAFRISQACALAVVDLSS